MRRLINSVFIACLAGCAPYTTEQRAAQIQNEVQQMIKVYGPACESLGYKSETDPWRDCILKLNTNKELENYITRSTLTQCWGRSGFYYRCY